MGKRQREKLAEKEIPKTISIEMPPAQGIVVLQAYRKGTFQISGEAMMILAQFASKLEKALLDFKLANELNKKSNPDDKKEG